MPSLRPVAFLLSLGLSLACRAQAPSPTEFFGHEVGADYELVNYTDLARYFRAVEAASDRVQLVDIGETSYGQRMLMAVISSPANLKNLEELRQISVPSWRSETSCAATRVTRRRFGVGARWRSAARRSSGSTPACTPRSRWRRKTSSS